MNSRTKYKKSQRCDKCEWIHESDSVTLISFKGVGLCPIHAAAPETAAERDRLREINKELVEACQAVIDEWHEHLSNMEMIEPKHLTMIRAALASAEGKVKP